MSNELNEVILKKEVNMNGITELGNQEFQAWKKLNIGSYESRKSNLGEDSSEEIFLKEDEKQRTNK